MKQNTGMWIWVVGIIVVAALGLWWLSTSQSVSTNMATTTTTGTTGTGANGNTIPKVDRSSSDVVSIAKNISGATTFASWLSSTGVAAEIKGKGPYTIFVPTDGAISQMKAGTFTSLSAVQKKRFVEYHVVAGRAIDVDAEVAGTIQALSKDVLNFSYGTNKIPMVNSAITITEYKGSNGVVYVIDNVLIPPKK